MGAALGRVLKFVPQADREQAIGELKRLIEDLPADSELKGSTIQICLGSEAAQSIAELMRRASEPEPDPAPGSIAAILEGLESVGAFDEYLAKRLHSETTT